MHDTFLFQKISDTLLDICRENSIKRIKKLVITVNYGSHVNSSSLFEHLLNEENALIDNSTIIEVNIGHIEDQTAIIESVEGDRVD